METAVAPVEATRTCAKCGTTLPLARFAVSRGCRGDRSWICLPCTRERKRRSERIQANPFGIDATNRQVEEAPDRRPAVRLRVELDRQRGRGRPWRSAWPAALNEALRGLPLLDQVSWRETFSQTARYWQANYEGTAAGPVLMLPDAD